LLIFANNISQYAQIYIDKKVMHHFLRVKGSFFITTNVFLDKQHGRFVA
jgi:hypothetical protein